jgi:glycosidase
VDNLPLEDYRQLLQLHNKYSTIQTGDQIPQKSNKPAVYSALRTDKNGIFLIVANLSDEAISEYNIVLPDLTVTKSTYSEETVFGADQAIDPERSGKAFPNISRSKV